MHINSYQSPAATASNLHGCNKPDSSSFKLPHSDQKQSTEATSSKPSLKAQLTNLQQITTKAISSISLAVDMSSAKYGSTNKTGFNSNNISTQIQKITDTLDTLISDMSEASGGGACPSGGKLDTLNNEISKAGDKIMKEPVQMSPEIHNILLEIKNLLTELQNMMQNRGNHHSQQQHYA